jgi:uncharacterized protein YyaL (SSP411 family)
MANRLIHEISPYLLQHAQNPVDWYPWGEEALDKAKKEDKPIFLSVGYAACHWCHVMEHESFENPEIAKTMNEHFISIKVDREERPDLDSIYMDAVVSMTGQGGWPMSVFLTPDGKPFYGGTYFPPVRRYNMPSFPELLSFIQGEWDSNRDRLLSSAEQLTDRLSSTLVDLSGGKSLDPVVLEQAAQSIFQGYDWKNGGWGSAPKFPQASTIEFMLHQHHRAGDKLALDIARHSLDRMWMGGIYDHLGGGFHRYSVDAEWLVPHFEKMLYDNALLMRVYLHAWQITGEPRYGKIVEEIIQFLTREMRDEEGGFFASLDADSEGVEGKFYVWDSNEIHEALNDPGTSELVQSLYDVTEKGNFEGKNILHLTSLPEDFIKDQSLDSESFEAMVADAKGKLLIIRDTRIRPAVDDKVLTEWNALTLIGLAETARFMNRVDILQIAQELAKFLLSNMIQDGRLKRSWRLGEAKYDAYLADYAALGEGLIALYQADMDLRWYEAAVELAEVILNHFTDPKGGFFDTRDDHESLISRPKSLQDTPNPSGNSLAVSLLLKLGAFSGDSRFLDPAWQALEGMQTQASQHPTAFAGWLTAINFALGPQLQLALMGSPKDENYPSLIDGVNHRFLPNLVLASSDHPTDLPELLSGREVTPGRTNAYLCQAFACRMPTSSAEELDRFIDESFSENTSETT